MFILLISPYESHTNQWQALVFATEDDAISTAKKKDLTKEYYICSVEALVELLRKVEWD